MRNELFHFSSGLRTNVSRLVFVRHLPNRPKEDNEIDHVKFETKFVFKQHGLNHNLIFFASVAEWSIAGDCKSPGFILRRFKSCPAHQTKTAYAVFLRREKALGELSSGAP